jgi:hypothetical protein
MATAVSSQELSIPMTRINTVKYLPEFDWRNLAAADLRRLCLL